MICPIKIDVKNNFNFKYYVEVRIRNGFEVLFYQFEKFLYSRSQLKLWALIKIQRAIKSYLVKKRARKVGKWKITVIFDFLAKSSFHELRRIDSSLFRRSTAVMKSI